MKILKYKKYKKYFHLKTFKIQYNSLFLCHKYSFFKHKNNDKISKNFLY